MTTTTSAPAVSLLQEAEDSAIQEGLAVLDEFIAAFNAEDSLRWSKTLHYPHVRIAGGSVTIWQSPEDYASSNDISLLRKTGWHHSRWDFRHLVQADADKLHLAVQFTRYDAKDHALGRFQALYVLTRQQGRWGVQARSSYAGVLASGVAF
ncbi:MAG: hypothetical protein LBC37_04385 [Zoogloeaceae bacterium]|jgi:hypothetical protein|nr:hypothetical protein [Zoogloeaceae bacterium]